MNNQLLLWHDRIDKLAKNLLSDEDVLLCEDDSGQWVDCACGAMDERIPRFVSERNAPMEYEVQKQQFKKDWIAMHGALPTKEMHQEFFIATGAPLDVKLHKLGMQFNRLWDPGTIERTGKVRAAERLLHILHAIEVRAGEILVEQGITQH